MKSQDDSDSLFYMSGGPLAAIVLGMALVPLRGVTTASNFTFAFLVLTIAVAEVGGRGPAVATALVSALSLDFFLTEPYLKLAIEAKDDIIAFAGLGICGLVAAALASPRRKEGRARRAARAQLDFLHSVVRELDGASVEDQLVRILASARAFLPLAAAVVRDDHGRVIASSDPSDRQRPIPEAGLDPHTLHPAALAARSPGFPEGGGRIALVASKRTVGWLDVWGDGRPADTAARRLLADVAVLASVLLARPADAVA